MTVILKGHNYKYAVEQLLLCLFPAERPVYGTVEDNHVTVSLSRGRIWITASAVLHWKGRTARHACRVSCAEADAAPDPVRVCQRIVKLAFYRAGVEVLGKEPPWGALTGVRPAKLPARAMLEGASPAQAQRELQNVYRVSPLRAELAVACAQTGLAVRRSLLPSQVSLYVGIPFCPTRCAYCSFISANIGLAMKLVEPYVSALIRELAAAGAALRQAGLSITSVYFGGGTPTTLSALQLDRVLSALAGHFDLSSCREYTVEAGRPDTITAEKLAVLRAHGVNRLSINPQTMDDAVLQAIGREHTAAQAEDAYRLARSAGPFSVNMDLIAGLPTDTAEGFCHSLERVLALAPENITIHTLARKRGTSLGESSVPGPGPVGHMLDHAWRSLSQAGYAPYYLYRQKFTQGAFENIGWCLPGHEGLYNICMMEELQTILSLGAGGMTKLVDLGAGRIVRRSNPKYPQDYLERIDGICREKENMEWLISCKKSTAGFEKT